MKDGSESKELLDSITSFIKSVQDSIDRYAAKVYLDENQSKSAQCLLFKYYNNNNNINTTIISKDDSLRGVVLSVRSGEIVRVAGNAIGLTGAGLIKIKRTDTEGYAYVR